MTYLLFFVTTAFLFKICASFVVHPASSVLTHDTILKQHIDDRTTTYSSTNETTSDYEIPGWVNKSVFKYNLPTFKTKQYGKHLDRMLAKRNKCM